ncbi:MAG: hypothetical protein L0Y72_05410 [Gemmataceae bacterium]|nr:hypothetical protein [Gemmataceae bacterium]
MKNKPCAFCGSTDENNPRTKGHVLQRCMYPEVGAESVRRITVRECARCSILWKDAEDNFRSLMVLCATEDNPHAAAQWDGPIRRSHGREQDGAQRRRDLLKWVVRQQTSDGEVSKLFPGSIESIHIVVRKMVRGLCHWHKLGTQVKDHQVLVLGQFENQPPADAKAVEFNHLPGVFRYSYFSRHLETDVFHVTWLLTFYEAVSFISLVSAARVKGFADLPP